MTGEEVDAELDAHPMSARDLFGNRGHVDFYPRKLICRGCRVPLQSASATHSPMEFLHFQRMTPLSTRIASPPDVVDEVGVIDVDRFLSSLCAP
jgi:hypothetical protein